MANPKTIKLIKLMSNTLTMEKIFSKIEEYGISIYNYTENNKLCGYELNTYTERGVNQILFLDFRHTERNPANPDDFIKILSEEIEDIDIDEEIELHRQMQDYKTVFSIRQSLEDFEDWKESLVQLVHKIESVNL